MKGYYAKLQLVYKLDSKAVHDALSDYIERLLRIGKSAILRADPDILLFSFHHYSFL